MPDYWFDQRYDDLMYDEHIKDHPRSDPKNCDWCKETTCTGCTGTTG